LIDKWPEDWRSYNQWAFKQIPSEIIEITKTYSFSDKYEIGGVKFFLHHGQLDRSIPAAIPYADTSSFEALDPGNDGELVLFGHNHIQFTHELGSKTYINPGSVGQPRCGRTHACYAVFEDGKYIPRQVSYDQRPWISALDKIDDLRQYPKFISWLKEGFLAGYGIGKREPWTQFHEEGYF
jgi:diadenosine tetraphosphatase ApaH/serine/threonine PP2A family protein phosphatase